MINIGMVNFINTAPLYEVWKREINHPDWRIFEGPPTILNEKLRRGELDLGFISCQEYAARPHLYRILSGLSISANGPVGSVFLFSRFDLADMDGRSLLLSSLSQTSVALVKIILEEYYQVRPNYQVGSVVPGSFPENSGDNIFDGVLAIGDNALRLKEQGSFPYCYDLGEIWQNHTGLPFVFALWAVRDDFFLANPGQTGDIHRALLHCCHTGRADLAAISRLVASRIPMDPDACYDYLKGMEFDLGPDKIKALEKFFGYIIARGEAPAAALPLKILNS